MAAVDAKLHTLIKGRAITVAMVWRTVGQDCQKCKETSNLDVIVMDMNKA